MSDRSDRKRFNFTLPAAYVEAIDHLIKEGIYMDTPDVNRDALRRLFQYHRIDPFYPPEPEVE